MGRGLPLYLFGHSLGGLVTCGSVVANSNSVKGVVLSSPALMKPHTTILRAIAGLGATFFPSRPVPLKREPPSCLSRIPEEIKRYEDDEQISKKQVCLLLGATALQCGQKVWNSRKDWGVPTLLLHGTADKATDCDTSKLFMEGIAASDKQTSILKDGYHELLRDLCQEEVLAILQDWFSRRLFV
jgi:alpha-beta hydrolase superfamily lysophospholipase